MGFFDRFRSKSTSANDDFDPLHPDLSKMKVGYLVDYDLKTWEVTAFNRYDYGDGYGSEEWQLKAEGETIYLGREKDDEVYWTLSRKIPLNAIDGDIRQYIMDNDDPPDKISVDGKTYFLDDSGSGHMYRNGKGEAIPFISWDFIDAQDKTFVYIEQWEETDFAAGVGYYVEEYQFSNILPNIA